VANGDSSQRLGVARLLNGSRVGVRRVAAVPARPSGAREGRYLIIQAIVASLGFTVSFMLLHHAFWGRHQLVDTPLYEAYGDATRAGDIPYLNFRLEYPPGALLAFLAPELTAAPGHFGAYGHAFEKWMAACGVVMTCLVVLALRLLRAGRQHVVLALVAVAVSPLLLGSVMLSRFDLLPAMLTTAAVVSLLAGRDRLGVALLAFAGVTKLYPLACIPIALLWVARRKGRREAGVCTAVALGVVTTVLAPFLVFAPAGLVDSLTVQLGRPLQIESLGASLLIAIHHLVGLRLTLHQDHGSRNIEGTAASWLGGISTACQAVLLGCVYWLFARGPASRGRLLTAVAASVAVFVAFGKVFSPQYMIWLIPLVPLVAGLPGLVASLLAATALVLTQLWYPDRYRQYADHLPVLESSLVLARDLAVVALAVVLLRALREPSPRRADSALPDRSVGTDLVVPAR
jgi:Glycosyltransferase family 87